MELTGEEKKIQTLFSELRLADKETAPSFHAIWNRAQIKSLRPRRAFNLSVVTATALLVLALVSLAWWVTRSRPTTPKQVARVETKAGPALTPSIPDTQTNSSVATAPGSPTNPIVRYRKPNLSTHRQATLLAANRKAVTDAKALSDWQSPTASLLASGNDELIKSVPQLDENSKDLKSFLPSKNK